MITAAQASLISKIAGSREFALLLEEIGKELFLEWTQTLNEQDREKIYYQFHAVTLLQDVIEAKLHEMTSGDTTV